MAHRIEIKVYPSSSKARIVEGDGRIKVYVHAAPGKGKANKAAIKLLAEHYGIKKNRLFIVGGAKNRFKTVEVRADD
jgi:hypothetical protein